MASLPREGIRDLRLRLRTAWIRAVRVRVRRDLFQAETELGYLAWEQADFYGEPVIAAVKKIQEFEATQAALQNTSAELSKRKAALDEELARENALHDQAQAALAAERAPIATTLEGAETARRQKLQAVERFDRAIGEIAATEKKLQAKSLTYLKITQPTLQIRTEARKISDELTGLSVERSLVMTDRERAAVEAGLMEAEITRLRGELQRIDSAASAARERLAQAVRRIAGETRLLEREKKKSLHRMSHLDRKKRQPYRFIGACLADHRIAPMNQPAVLEKVVTLRRRHLDLAKTLAQLRTARATTAPGPLIAFYLFLAVLLIALCVIASHFIW